MKNLLEAIEEEKKYIEDKKRGLDTSLLSRLEPFGYDNLTEYFDDKREYMFSQWQPEIFYYDINNFVELEQAIQNSQYGIYICCSNGPYVFHGNDIIDYNLCNELGVTVAEMHYFGGTIIGNNSDFGIEIVAPAEINLNCNFIMNKFYEIISKYVNNAEIVGNDILVDGKKVMGTMCRATNNLFVWAAQISFSDHSELIQKVCNKKSAKIPGYIDNTKLNKEQLEREVLSWLQKQ